MRILPDKPSVEFLRKEAKDLLAALRESGSEASLGVAQRAQVRSIRGYDGTISGCDGDLSTFGRRKR